MIKYEDVLKEELKDPEFRKLYYAKEDKEEKLLRELAHINKAKADKEKELYNYYKKLGYEEWIIKDFLYGED